MSDRLFVYGTLRLGDVRAPLLAGARRLGTRSVAGFELYDLGPYPGVVTGDGAVVGELVELPDRGLLERLDEVEGTHEVPPLYRRERIEVDGGRAWIYVYARPVDPARRIATGDWLRRG